MTKKRMAKATLRTRKPQDAVVSNVKRLRADVRMLQKVFRIALIDTKKLTARVDTLELEVGDLLAVLKPLL